MKRLLSFSGWKLHWKFFFIFFTLVLVPIFAFSLYIYSEANQAIQLQAVNNTRGHLEKIDQNISAFTSDIEDISSYMIYSEDIRSFLRTEESPGNRTYLNDMERRITGFTTFHLTSKFYLHSISLSSVNGHHLDMGTPLKENQEDVWKVKAEEFAGKPYWSDAYKIRDAWGRDRKVVSLFRVINDVNNVSLPLGMVTIRFDALKFYELIDTDFKNLETMFVLNHHGQVVMHPDEDMIGKPYPDENIVKAIIRNGDKNSTLQYERDDVNYTIVTQPVAGADLVILGAVNEKSVAEGITSIQQSILIMMIALTLFGLLAIFGFYYFNIRRIRELTRETRQLERGDFSANVSVGSSDEIGLLGMRFNKMVERLRYLIDNEYKMELRNRESELKLLQSQINPHFLYNTLDMIRWTARLEKAMETSKLIEQLSKMFRISLNRGKPWITLKDELTYSQGYLDLQKRRLGKKLQYTLYCDHAAMGSIMLKQTIQPLIENSLHHGFENMRTERKIYIRCFRDDQDLVIDVLDNGKGFGEGTTMESIQSGYALKNIQDRLLIAFGSRASLTIEDKPSPGAWVRVRFPYLETEEEIEVWKSAGE
ncbi:sensor histidine kinase [Anaerobacillus sp. 1_MG-2023]|uniref:sensor histidine kinase n=1 Tax=Anaerobacillus sp. 1_MG-2023 TaxID=3062655 RepID=UPI0026E2253A|nr:sensor histidine kinase [Anaerobacillus sp. 1_MG-2023]MDO6657048.1 sensor histidine kinase [Anaerobacillus sp. 1_MG-2023]